MIGFFVVRCARFHGGLKLSAQTFRPIFRGQHACIDQPVGNAQHLCLPRLVKRGAVACSRGLCGMSGTLKVAFPRIDKHALPTSLRLRPQFSRLKCDGVEGLGLDHAPCTRIGKRSRPVTVLDHTNAAAHICRQSRMRCRNPHLHPHLVSLGKKWCVALILATLRGGHIGRRASARCARICLSSMFSAPAAGTSSSSRIAPLSIKVAARLCTHWS